MASRSLDDLDPHAKSRCSAWLELCRMEGIDVLVYCTYRSSEEQNELYKIGRSLPGKIVTCALGGQSYHQYRCAWDAVPLIAGKPAWSNSKLYKRMGELAGQLGIDWAGLWISFKETAHFQYTGGLSLAQLRNGEKICG